MAGMYTPEPEEMWRGHISYPDPKTSHHPIEEVKKRAKNGDANAQRALETRKMLVSRGIAEK